MACLINHATGTCDACGVGRQEYDAIGCRLVHNDGPTSGDPYVTKLLGDMAKLYAERNAVYKDNYKMVGRIMEAMFPDGIELRTAEEFNRWHLFELAIVKLSRYAVQYKSGGHQDSIEDMIVYLAMVAGLDDEARPKDTTNGSAV